MLRQSCSLIVLLSLLASIHSHSSPAPEQQSVPNHAVILLYHHVADDTPAITSISPALFEQQLQYLQDNHFLIWPLTKVLSALQDRQVLPDKVVAITFDDSYRSVYTQAFPQLKKRQWPFTIFVSSDAIDQQFSFQTNWQQLRLMSKHGATIANHSASHDHLLQKKNTETEQQWQQRVRHDLLRAQQRIKQEIGYKPTLFAYPYGEYNSKLAKIVKDMGFVALGQQSGAVGENTSWQAVPRFPIAGQYGQINDFAIKVMTLPLAIKSISSPENPLDYTQVKPELTIELIPASHRLHSLQCFGSGQGRLKLQAIDDENNIVVVIPAEDIPVGRSRYNCTLPAANNRFYWFSHLWLRLDKNNLWLAE